MRRPLALYALSALLPLVILGVAVGVWSFYDQRRDVEDQARNHADFVAALVGRELVANMRSVQMIAQSPAFDGGLDAARFEKLASRLLADEPLWRTLSVSTPLGQRVLDAPQPIGLPNGPVVDIESHQRAVGGASPTVGRLRQGPSGGWAFAVRAPVSRGGKVIYVVSAIVEPSVLSRLLLAENLPDGWAVEVVDETGTVVAHAPGGATLIGRNVGEAALASRESGLDAPYHGRGADGRSIVGLWRRAPSSEWTVHVSLPAADYAAPAARATGVLVLGLLASLAIAAVMSSLLLRDIRLQRRREAAALEGQRLEALGKMTGGVAHDFNNLLTPIVGGLDILHRRHGNDPRSRRVLEAAIISAERARTLVSRLLTFARRQSLEPRDVDVANLLEGLTDLLEGSVGPGVKVELDVRGELPAARVDPAQLELAVLNLAVNARDAMPEGGRLRIAAADDGDPPSELPKGRYVRIAVTDEGHGMDAATLRRAVEPFFTTKDVGKGTGLGLSMVHGLAAQSGGALRLVSAPGEGTTAEIWLPASAAAAPPRAQPQALTAGRQGRLMLVDDDDLVRASTAELLRDHGHAVVEARSAFEALALLREGAATDLLVTDYAMPGKTGAELISEARLMRPGLPALLISGYANAADDTPADVTRLAKPFRRTELLNRVAGLLPEPA